MEPSRFLPLGRLTCPLFLDRLNPVRLEDRLKAVYANIPLPLDLRLILMFRTIPVLHVYSHIGMSVRTGKPRNLYRNLKQLGPRRRVPWRILYKLERIQVRVYLQAIFQG